MTTTDGDGIGLNFVIIIYCLVTFYAHTITFDMAR